MSITKAKVMLAVAGLSLAACSQTQAPNTQATAPAAAEIKSGIYLENMDTSVRPGEDFNRYVNGKWIDRTEIPGDKGRYGAFGILADAAEENVRKIIEESASSNPAPGSDEQKVGDLFASYINAEAREQAGLTPLKAGFDEIDALENQQQLASYFAKVNKIGVNVPMVLGQYADFKDPTKYMTYTWQGGLGLPDREYYFEEDEKSVELRKQYLAHIQAMLELAKIDDAAAKAETIMALETRIASEHMLKEQARNMVAIYNRFDIEQLPELMPNFDWNAYLSEAGAADLSFLVVPQVDYSKALDTIITETPMSTWHAYLKWKYLSAHASLLTKAIDEQQFAFYGKQLRGTETMKPQWRRGVDLVNANLGEVVGKVYIKRHFPPQAKARMQELVDNLIKAYEVSIKELEWMGEETRAQALDKLSKFTPKIGYPDVWRDYSAVSISKDDLVGNVHAAKLADYKRQMDRRNEDVDRTEWGMTPQTVNAYYSPPLNEIVFPAAILQPPFFDLNADDAVNYGGIGAVIGHEIGHGFDDSGSTFDGDGVLRNWWTDQDREEFKKRTAVLVDQYNGYRPFEGDDLHVNGEFTLGENIGDLGGLSIGLLAYKMSLGDQPAPVLDGFTGEQRVMIGYGQVWINKYRDEFLRTQINTDPHSPAQYRVNGIVRNVPEFYEAFDVKPEDALYLPPEQRVKIW